MWVNSLGVDGVYINNLFEDVKDGLVLLKVLDKMEPGTVDWKKVEKNTNHIIKKVSNNNLVCDIGKSDKFKLNLVQTSGKDIAAGNKKLILGYLW